MVLKAEKKRRIPKQVETEEEIMRPALPRYKRKKLRVTSIDGLDRESIEDKLERLYERN